MKTNKTLMLAVTLSLFAMQPYNAFAANADSFRTDEYKNIGENVLDLINAADAYAQGYTGKGVTVGVTDVSVVNFAHPEFAGKDNNTVVHDVLNGNYGNLTWSNLNHATHVAGIVAANKDGAGMHGVAFNAGIASSSAAALYDQVNSPYEAPGFSTAISMYDYYLTNPDIKIINNSWGSPGVHISTIQNENDFYDSQSGAANDDGLKAMGKAVHNDKLLVFCAMNEGNLTATGQSDLDILTGDKAFNDNIITVTAAKANSFTKNENGGFDVKSDAIAIFSNLAMYNEDTSLSAPGWDITSAYADFENREDYYGDYFTGSRTSQAAPIVSGVGALVQQAFPYLGGKQIGDVLLSTANNDITNTNGYFVNNRCEYDRNGILNDYYNILITGKNSNLNKEGYIEGWSELYDYFKNNKETVVERILYGVEEDWEKYFGENGSIKSAEDFENQYKDVIGAKPNINIYNNVPLDVIFGQGIVDAGKVVKGLGAINVRRLDSSDISDKYTVTGEGKTGQALYKVDTQGYNSVWSNDISEIRAGYIAENPLGDTHTAFDGADSDIKDLHDRWVFYKTNKFDESGENWMTEYYMEQYNKQVAQSGLAGLHAGLYKTGEGVLSLTGNNTYKGASIAAGGILQIDGSVAGDAYSEGIGTIAGSGTINGSLYNCGAVQAGSWGVVTDEEGSVLNLKVNGKFEGDGVIAVNTDGKYYAVINVGESADVSKMSLKAAEFAAPEVTGTFLTSNNVITVGNFNTDFSGLLNSKVENNGKGLTLTTSVNNNAGITGDRFNAINSLYDNLSADEQQEMYRLYALDDNELRGAMQNISASEGMHLELARDAMQNRDVRQAVTCQQHLERDEAFWAISGKSWGDTDYGVNRHSFNLTLGRDFYNDDDAYAGVLFAYSDNSVYGNNAEGEYDNYTVALYGSTKNKPGTVTGYVSYGVQDNEITRHLGGAFSHSGLSTKAESDYDSSVIGAGAKYAYDLHYGKEGWHLSMPHWIMRTTSRTALPSAEVCSACTAAVSVITI